MDRQPGRTGKAPARRGLAFSRHGTAAASGSSRSGILIGQLLAFLFLGACAWRMLRELALVLPADRVTAALSARSAVGPVFAWRLAAFSAAVIACHVLLGLAATYLAQLTNAARLRSPVARPGVLVTAWFALLVALVMAANAAWYPGSAFSGGDSWLQSRVAGWQPAAIALLASAALAVALLIRAAYLSHGRALRGPAIVGVAGLLSLGLMHAPPLPPAGASGRAPVATHPNVVIIGIDSLRADLVEAGGPDPLTPHIDEFLRPALRFDDAITPLARTYGSWVSILTGRHPVTTHARVNLMPRSQVQTGGTLADALRAQGFGTYFATDEVRFANIDESYGFDRVISPPIGASDFLLGHAGDLPLVNLVAPTPLGRWLFPSNHANRAAYLTYEPEDFVKRVDRELRIDRPSFIAIHLTLAHWPYSWSGLPLPGGPKEYRTAYRRAIGEVDRQFAALMESLGAKGILDNAVVILLSDHGEALGGPSDSMLRSIGTSRQIWDSLWGHGTSVMSPNQYRVLLAMRAFGQTGLEVPATRVSWPVSLVDLRPTLEELAIGHAAAGLDGLSLLPYLADPSRATNLDGRVRFTETDFNTPSTLAGKFEAKGVVDEAAVYYEIDPESGWVQFREDRLPDLLAQKQRAAMTPHSLLAAIPGPAGGAQRYLLTSRDSPAPVVLEGPPESWSSPDARGLYAALSRQFPGELNAPSDTPRM